MSFLLNQKFFPSIPNVKSSKKKIKHIIKLEGFILVSKKHKKPIKTPDLYESLFDAHKKDHINKILKLAINESPGDVSKILHIDQLVSNAKTPKIESLLETKNLRVE